MSTRATRAKSTAAAKRKAFIAALTKSANVSRAAELAGVASSTVYRWRTEHDSFRLAWDDAINAALDALEAALIERAVKGVVKPIMYGGKQIGTTRAYSDNAAMFLLRARRPQIYGREAVSAPAAAIDTMVELIEIERKLDLVAGRPMAIE